MSRWARSRKRIPRSDSSSPPKTRWRSCSGRSGFEPMSLPSCRAGSDRQAGPRTLLCYVLEYSEKFRLQLGVCSREHTVAGRLPVVYRSRPVEVSEPPAGFVHQKIAGRKVPVAGARTGKSGIEPAGGNRSETVGKRRDMGLDGGSALPQLVALQP